MKHRTFGSFSGRLQQHDSTGLDNTPCQIALTSKHLPEFWVFLKRRAGLLQQKSQAGGAGCKTSESHNPTLYLVDFVHAEKISNAQFCQECNSRLRNQQLIVLTQNFLSVPQVHMGEPERWPSRGATRTVYRTGLQFPRVLRVSLQEEEFDTFSCF